MSNAPDNPNIETLAQGIIGQIPQDPIRYFINQISPLPTNLTPYQVAEKYDAFVAFVNRFDSKEIRDEFWQQDSFSFKVIPSQIDGEFVFIPQIVNPANFNVISYTKFATTICNSNTPSADDPNSMALPIVLFTNNRGGTGCFGIYSGGYMSMNMMLVPAQTFMVNSRNYMVLDGKILDQRLQEQ